MIQIIQKISVEVAKPNFFQAIVAKQFDNNSRFLRVTLKNENEVIKVATTSTVTINAKRSDGTENSFSGTVNDDGTFTVPLTYWILELNGTVECDVSVIGADDSKLTSTKFVVEVEKASCSNANVGEAENYDILIVQAKDIVSKAELAEAVNPFKRRLTYQDDLNNLVEPGVYYFITTDPDAPEGVTPRPANAPFDNGAIVEVIATGDTTQRIIQRVTRYGLAGSSKERVLSNSNVWLDWVVHPLFFVLERTVTTNENGNFVFTLEGDTMILSIRAIPTDASISACSVTPYWSTSYNKWGCHVTNSSGSALTNTEVTVSIIYTKKG